MLVGVSPKASERRCTHVPRARAQTDRNQPTSRHGWPWPYPTHSQPLRARECPLHAPPPASLVHRSKSTPAQIRFSPTQHVVQNVPHGSVLSVAATPSLSHSHSLWQHHPPLARVLQAPAPLPAQTSSRARLLPSSVPASKRPVNAADVRTNPINNCQQCSRNSRQQPDRHTFVPLSPSVPRSPAANPTRPSRRLRTIPRENWV